MLPFFRRKTEPKPTGDWWTDTFTLEERATIEGVFAPIGGRAQGGIGLRGLGCGGIALLDSDE